MDASVRCNRCQSQAKECFLGGLDSLNFIFQPILFYAHRGSSPCNRTSGPCFPAITALPSEAGLQSIEPVSACIHHACKLFPSSSILRNHSGNEYDDACGRFRNSTRDGLMKPKISEPLQDQVNSNASWISLGARECFCRLPASSSFVDLHLANKCCQSSAFSTIWPCFDGCWRLEKHQIFGAAN